MKKSLALFLAGWTLLIAALIGWELLQERSHVEEHASIEAKAIWEHNLSYRKWVTAMGGVYVRKDKMKPNPYLTVPDRDKRTVDGIALTMANPAYMTNQVFDIIRKETDPPIINRIVSDRYLNPRNKPDDWESAGLRAFSRGAKEVQEVVTLNGQPYMRYFKPILVVEGCLKCHAQQGYKTGDIRGGISIAIPMKGFSVIEAASRKATLLPFLVIWTLGAGGIVAFMRRMNEKQILLQESEEKYRSFIESANDAVLVHSIDEGGRPGPFFLVNELACERFGYTREEFAQLTPRELNDPEHLDHIPAVMEQLQQEGHAVFETVLMTKDGGRVPVEISTRLLRLKNRSCIFSLARDITERKEREAFIRNVLESVDEGFIVVDREFRIKSANRAFCRMVGATEAEIIGRDCYAVSHRTAKACYELGEECAVKRTFGTGLPYSVIHAHTSASGAVQYVEIKSYPIADASGKVVSAIETMNDITEKRRLEEQLRQSQKMEAIGQLAGGVAHDFNNILMAIMGYGNLIQMKLPADDPLRLNMNPLLESADRAAQLTRSLLAFSRKQVMHLAPVSVNDILLRTEKFLRRIIGEDVELRTLPGRNVLVLADSAQVEQVLMNLATNARDAMPHGGALSIATEVLEVAAEEVLAHGVEAPGPYVVISVSDTGTGMDEETKQKIFVPFFTTKELGRGTGLGLAIVYGIVKQHRGTIAVTSQPGTGSTFRIYLPVHFGATEPREQLQKADPIVGGRETILLAEDDQVLRKFLAELLAEFGYAVIAAEDGMDAVQKFAEHADAVRLCILDMIMPRKGGIEAYEEIVRMRPGVKAIFSSGYAADKVQRDGLPAGCEFIQKPAAPEVFLKRIREVLDRGQGMGPSS